MQLLEREHWHRLIDSLQRGQRSLGRLESFFEGLKGLQENNSCSGGETLAQIIQRNCCCPISRSVKGQSGRGFEQPDEVGDVSVHGSRVGIS